MDVFAGIDLGTSGVKVVLVDTADECVAEATERLDVATPHPGWSEQDPEAWWTATVGCFDRLKAEHPQALARVAGIGLSGQMLAAVLLDRDDRPVRPAILWNDQRALAECKTLAARAPDIARRTNGAPDPGLTAPKLLWLAAHEPEVFARADVLLLTKDYVRLKLTGERGSEPSDAGGTMLMDCASRCWDADLCAAAGWSVDRLPRLGTSWDPLGGLRSDLAARWGLPADLPVAGGAGDNMACCLGVGAADPGDTVITVGTSGVVCIVDERFHPAPESAVLTNPHAAPDSFLSMGVVMSATGTVDWLLRLTGVSITELAAAVAAFVAEERISSAPVFVPSLTGIRTPHNRPGATGRLCALRPMTDVAAIGYAVFEGVAFQLAECIESQQRAGAKVGDISVVGGGARNPLWVQLIASTIGRPMIVPAGAQMAAPLGAARLARIAATGCDARQTLSRKRTARDVVGPSPSLSLALAARRERFDALLRSELA